MANDGIVARVRRSELEAQIKHSTRSQRRKHLHSNFRRTNRAPLLFTVLGLPFCDFCFALILLSEQTLRATVDPLFHLSPLTNFFWICQQSNSMASSTGATAAAAAAESK